MGRKTILNSAILVSLFCFTTLALAKPVKNRLELNFFQATKSNGEYAIFIQKQGGWQEVGRLSFDRFFRERSIDLVTHGSDEEFQKIRIVQKGGGAAHIDKIMFGGLSPSDVRDSEDPAALTKLSKKDFDVIDVFEKNLELTFPSNGKDRVLSLTARVESKSIDKTPFQFPQENLRRVMDETSLFYSYGMGTQKGNLGEDGTLNLSSRPFFQEHCRTGSGHPPGFTYGWVGHDAENVYVTIDFTPDNTMDGEKDYAKVYVKTETGLKEFKVSVPEAKWGKPRFTYTDKVPYQHKVYDFKIPRKEIGLADTAEPQEIQLAFAAYGTATPGDYAPVVAYNSQTNQYLVVYAKYDGVSFEYDVYAQILSLDGTPVGSEFVISDETSNQEAPSVAAGSNGKFLVVWTDGRSGTYHIYGQLVNGDGTLEGSNFIISDVGTNKWGQRVVNDPTNQRFLVVWVDSRSGNYNIYGQLVTEEGVLYGTASDENFVISDAASTQDFPNLTHDSLNNRFLVAWHDSRTSGNYDIYGQLINSDGSLYGTASNVNFLISDASNSQKNVSVAFDEVNSRFLLVWHDNRDFGTTLYDIYGQLVNSDGSLFDDNFPISSDSATQMNPVVTRLACNGGYLVSWEDGRSEISYDAYGQFVNEDGTLNGAHFVISEPDGDQMYTSSAGGSNCRALVVYETWETGAPEAGISTFEWPNMVVSPDSLDFGGANVGSSSTLEITLSNEGSEDLEITSAELSGTDAEMFNVESGGSNPCGDFPVTLGSGSGCTLIVTFLPATYGAKIATLTISSNDFDEPAMDVPLSGTGTSSRMVIVSPNGGEILASGESATIEWGATGNATKSKLFYSTDNAATWKKITDDYVTGNTYEWTIPAPMGNKKKSFVRVIGYTDSNERVGADKSDTAFTIEVVKLTSPDGGETLHWGQNSTIEWTVNATKNDLAEIKLYYTKNNGTTWNFMYSPLDLEQRTYEWTLPTGTTTKTKCKVKVVLKDVNGNTLGQDTSNDVFTIDTGTD